MNSYGKKEKISRLLGQELKESRYRINANFEWTKPSQVMSLKVYDKNVIRLGINLNFNEDFQIKGETAEDLNIFYRAWFIASYIHCMEGIYDAKSKSYFSGLVELCAINNVCSNGYAVSFSPVEEGRVKCLRPIDVQCAISALTRLVIEKRDVLSLQLGEKLEALINRLLTYSILPEVGYSRTKPVYSLLFEFNRFNYNVKRKRCIAADYMLFRECELENYENVSLDDLPTLLNESRSAFWTGAYIRLVSSMGKKDVLTQEQRLLLRKTVNRFNSDCIRYYKDYSFQSSNLLDDNYLALKRMSNRINTVLRIDHVNDGMIHCYQ